MSDAYYLPREDAGMADQGYDTTARIEYFEPTPNTVSVWGDHLQHGGPPTGLMIRCLDRHPGGEGKRLARFTVDILGPIGLSTNRIRTEVIRPGKRISLVQSTLEVANDDGGYRAAARATGGEWPPPIRRRSRTAR